MTFARRCLRLAIFGFNHTHITPHIMKALIIENGIGGWSILTAQRQIGNYATAADAQRVALLNGWEVSNG